MARHPFAAGELGKLLNACATPVYVLDNERAIVFCNSACLEWLGRDAADLYRRQCVYHSEPDESNPDSATAGLCPPPGAMAGKALAGIVAPIGPDGQISRRRAQFIPLGDDPTDAIGLVVIVDGKDLPESHDVSSQPAQPPSPTVDQTETSWLHERLGAFRHQARARYRVDRVIGDGAAMRRVRSQIVLAAQTDTRVLVIGPPGSGRQHVASTIHYSDPNAGTMFPVDCLGLGPDLIRSTVAALATRRAATDQGSRSTLLLHDADAMPREVQAELARQFAAPSFGPRVIATAGVMLDDLVLEDKYREDLASILSTLVIELPPLDERRSDLPMLAQFFVEEQNTRGPKQLAGLSPEALDRLAGYDWPGNVDELILIVTSAHARAEGPRIGDGDLPEQIHLAAHASAYPARREETIRLDEFLEQIESELIRRAMRQAKGNKTKAAKLLGVTRPRLYRRLVQFGMEPDT